MTQLVQSMHVPATMNRIASAKQVREEKLSSYYDNDYADIGILGGTGLVRDGRL